MFHLLGISPRSVGLFAAALAVCAAAKAEPLAQIRPFLKQHCFDCHSGDAPESGLNLETLSDALEDGEVHRRWVYLHDRVASSEMPPESADQPSAEATTAFLKTLGDALTHADLASRATVLRRLNRDEYENTVHDLFGIYVDVHRLLPSDGREQGFDTTSASLSLSTEQMLSYVEAADLVLDRVFGPPNKPAAFDKMVNFGTTPRGVDESERKLDDGVVLFSGAKHLRFVWDCAQKKWPLRGSSERELDWNPHPMEEFQDACDRLF